VELRATTASLALAEEFGIARGARSTQSVVQGGLEHEGIVGVKLSYLIRSDGFS
jgi:hypothetical protein